MKKKIFILLISVLILTGCTSRENTIEDKLLSAMNSKINFITEDNETKKLSDIDDSLNPISYLFVDLDGDDNKELIVNLYADGNLGFKYIFRYNNKRVYGYKLDSDEIKTVTDKGIIEYFVGYDIGYAKYSFKKNKISKTVLFNCNITSDSCEEDGETFKYSTDYVDKAVEFSNNSGSIIDWIEV